MSKSDPLDPPSLAQSARWEEAARLLEQAVKAGNQDPHAAYLLALCYKRQGKLADARTALRKIARPDANILLQLGILSMREGQYAQAEEELSRARQMDPSAYEAGFNLVLTRLATGQTEPCKALLAEMIPRAPGAVDKRFLLLLAALLHRAGGAAASPLLIHPERTNGDAHHEAVLSTMTGGEEQRLLHTLRGLADVEAVYPLLRVLAEARPHSPAVQEAHLEVVMVQARKMLDRCQWTAAENFLQPLARVVEAPGPGQALPRHTQVALLNMLGCCACMIQAFERGVRYFTAALKWSVNDAWLHQNLALAWELQDRPEQADMHWTRYFDLLDARTPAPAIPRYIEGVAYEGLSRLAELYARKEKWSSALAYAQRAHRLRPGEVDMLERLFHLYNQVRRPEDARRTLRKLRDLRPGEAQFELYELDIREVRSLEDIDHLLGDIRRILAQHPGDMRVEERAVVTVGNVIPQIGRLSDQYSERLARIVEQVRRLPSYQVNWPVVHDEMHRFHREFQKLRRIAQKCLALVTQDEHRRIIKELTDLIDNKIEVCQSLGG